MIVDVLEAVGDQFNLSSELLHAGTLSEFDTLSASVGDTLGDSSDGLSLDMGITEGDDVLLSSTVQKVVGQSLLKGVELPLEGGVGEHGLIC